MDAGYVWRIGYPPVWRQLDFTYFKERHNFAVKVPLCQIEPNKDVIFWILFHTIVSRCIKAYAGLRLRQSSGCVLSKYVLGACWEVFAQNPGWRASDQIFFSQILLSLILKTCINQVIHSLGSRRTLPRAATFSCIFATFSVSPKWFGRVIKILRRKKGLVKRQNLRAFKRSYRN